MKTKMKEDKGYVIVDCPVCQRHIPLSDENLYNALQMKIYYSNIYRETRWMGTKIYKLVFDAWTYQEILYKEKPDIIIETGTAFGGSALFMAHIFDHMNKGFVVTVDLVKRKVPQHKRIKYLIGSSCSKRIVKKITNIISGLHKPKLMVILDSDHYSNHVAKELKIYSKLVTVGQYLIIEDTNLGGNPITSDEPGPMKAVEEFLKHTDSFAIDRSQEKFGITFNPKGYLKRIR